MPREVVTCKHYRCPSVNAECRAGVSIASLIDRPMSQWPCLGKRGDPYPTGCPSAAFPTEAEIAADKSWIEARLSAFGLARRAIVEALGGPWSKTTPNGGSGQIPCPVCKTGTLGYSMSSYNGHIHARCSTPKCVNWIE